MTMPLVRRWYALVRGQGVSIRACGVGSKRLLGSLGSASGTRRRHSPDQQSNTDQQMSFRNR